MQLNYEWSMVEIQQKPILIQNIVSSRQVTFYSELDYLGVSNLHLFCFSQFPFEIGSFLYNPCGKTPVFRREMKAWLYILLVFDVFHDGLLRYHSCTPYIIRARPQCGQTAPQPIMALSKHMGRIPLHSVDDQLRGYGRGCQIQSNVI